MCQPNPYSYSDNNYNDKTQKASSRIGTGQVSSFVPAQVSIFEDVSKGSESKI